MNLTAGVTLQSGKYFLKYVLEQGRAERAFKAIHTHLNQPVVIKTLQVPPQVLIDFAQLKQQFLEAVRRYAHCQHPGLVRVLDCFEEGGLPFVVMEDVTGQSLAEVVQTSAPLTEQQALQTIRQVGSALAVLHRNGLVHQDVQPATMIRLGETEAIALMAPSFVPELPTLDQATTTGQEFTAIELYEPEAIPTPAADIYALASSLYFLLTGQVPIPAPLRSRTPQPSLRQFQPGISSAIEVAIVNGMNLETRSRPHTIAGWFSLLPDINTLSSVQKLPTQDIPTTTTTPAIPVQLPQLVVSSNRPAPIAHTQQITSSYPSSFYSSSFKPHRRKTLIMVAAIASSIGLGMGLALRFKAATGTGSSVFHTKQEFPADEEWENAVSSFKVPIAAPTPESPVEQQWTSPPPVQRAEPVWEPVVPKPQPEPSSEPTAEVSPLPEPQSSPDSMLPRELPPAELPPASPAPIQPVVTEPVPSPIQQPEGMVQNSNEVTKP